MPRIAFNIVPLNWQLAILLVQLFSASSIAIGRSCFVWQRYFEFPAKLLWKAMLLSKIALDSLARSRTDHYSNRYRHLTQRWGSQISRIPIRENSPNLWHSGERVKCPPVTVESCSCDRAERSYLGGVVGYQYEQCSWWPVQLWIFDSLLVLIMVLQEYGSLVNAGHRIAKCW